MKRAVITGASSGIGLALAHELVTRGWAVALLARRTDLLQAAVASLNESAGRSPAPATAVTCDVSDAEAVASAVRRAEGEFGGAFDLAVANAGMASATHATSFDAARAGEVVRVNVVGTMNLFAAVVGSMIARRSGRFAGVASLVGLRGVPTAAAYSASKAAIQAFLEASRIELAPYGVGVSIINPGFVSTAMTSQNRFRMPFLMNAAKAASVIADGLERGKRVIEFPRLVSLAARAMRHMPDPLYDALMLRAARIKMGRS